MTSYGNKVIVIKLSCGHARANVSDVVKKTEVCTQTRILRDQTSCEHGGMLYKPGAAATAQSLETGRDQILPQSL